MPQPTGTCRRMPVGPGRTPDLTASVAQAMRMSRAFYGHGVLLWNGARLLLVDESDGWPHPHDLAPGQDIPSMEQERGFAVRESSSRR